jgi:magnesium transporter
MKKQFPLIPNKYFPGVAIMLKRMDRNPGAAPGVEHEEIILMPGESGEVTITCTDYCSTQVAVQDIEDLKDFLDHHRPEWSAVRWINVAGLSDRQVIHALATKYNLHPLAIEDVLHLSQRPKVEPYGGDDSEYQARLFIVAHALQIMGESLHSEQVSIFLGHNTVLTIEETPSTVWDPIRQRLLVRSSRLRNNDASFLMYCCWMPSSIAASDPPKHIGDRAEELEVQLLEDRRAVSSKISTSSNATCY